MIDIKIITSYFHKIFENKLFLHINVIIIHRNPTPKYLQRLFGYLETKFLVCFIPEYSDSGVIEHM